MARLQRWMAGSKALVEAGVPITAEAEATIEAGEVWFYTQ